MTLPPNDTRVGASDGAAPRLKFGARLEKMLLAEPAFPTITGWAIGLDQKDEPLLGTGTEYTGPGIGLW